MALSERSLKKKTADYTDGADKKVWNPRHQRNPR